MQTLKYDNAVQGDGYVYLAETTVFDEGAPTTGGDLGYFATAADARVGGAMAVGRTVASLSADESVDTVTGFATSGFSPAPVDPASVVTGYRVVRYSSDEGTDEHYDDPGPSDAVELAVRAVDLETGTEMRRVVARVGDDFGAPLLRAAENFGGYTLTPDVVDEHITDGTWYGSEPSAALSSLVARWIGQTVAPDAALWPGGAVLGPTVSLEIGLAP